MRKSKPKSEKSAILVHDDVLGIDLNLQELRSSLPMGDKQQYMQCIKILKGKDFLSSVSLRRAAIIYLFLSGYNSAYIADLVQFSIGTVYRTLRLLASRGFDHVMNQRSSFGRQGICSPEKRNEILLWFQTHSPRDIGIPLDKWTIRTARKVTETVFGLHVKGNRFFYSVVTPREQRHFGSIYSDEERKFLIEKMKLRKMEKNLSQFEQDIIELSTLLLAGKFEEAKEFSLLKNLSKRQAYSYLRSLDKPKHTDSIQRDPAIAEELYKAVCSNLIPDKKKKNFLAMRDYHLGKRIVDVSHAYGIHRATVYQDLRRLSESSLDKFIHNVNKHGRRRTRSTVTFTEEQERKVLEAVGNPPGLQGFSEWNSESLRKFVFQQFGIKLSPVYASNYFSFRLLEVVFVRSKEEEPKGFTSAKWADAFWEEVRRQEKQYGFVHVKTAVTRLSQKGCSFLSNLQNQVPKKLRENHYEKVYRDISVLHKEELS